MALILSHPEFFNIMISKQEGIRIELGGLGGQFAAIIDQEDYEKVSKYRWIAHGLSNNRYVYAVRYEYYRDREVKSRKRRVYLHRELLNAPGGLFVDHANHDTLDNRRSNLRLATRSDNAANSMPRRTAKSGFRGVYERKPSGSFTVRYRQGGLNRYIGDFRCPIEAARAYDRAVLADRGEFAVLNFPIGEIAA